MSEYRGADPAGLDFLGSIVAVKVGTLTRASAEAHRLLEDHERSAAADRSGSRLSRVSRILSADASDLRRRAELVRQAERLSPGRGVPPLVTDEAWLRAEFALLAPMGLADWEAGFRGWHDGPSIHELIGLEPVGVATAVAGSSHRALRRLLLTHPDFVGGLDGAPPELRYAANRILVQREIARLESVATDLEAELAEMPLADVGGDFWLEAQREVVRDEISEVDGVIDRYRLWADERRQILLFDPSGDGRVAEVFGDLAAADHVAVIVPGIANDSTNFGPVEGGGFRDNGSRLHDAASALDDAVATIAWLGYDTPDGAGAVVRKAADAGHGDLVRFIDGMIAGGDRHITVIGHSYGSLVTGMAAGGGLRADEVVFVGSPGTSLDHAGDANLPSGGEVWAGLADWDPIGAGISLVPDDIWESALSIPGRYLWDLMTTGDFAVEDLWHGTNPAHESFGATEFTTDRATGHSQYFHPGTESLENLARIVAGHTAQVRVLLSKPIELAPGSIATDGIDATTIGAVI